MQDILLLIVRQMYKFYAYYQQIYIKYFQVLYIDQPKPQKKNGYL